MFVRKYWFILFLCTMLLPLTSFGQTDPNAAFRAYSNAFLYPETFDQYAAENLRPNSESVLLCINRVRNNLAARYADAVAHCDLIAPEYRDGCYQTDSAALNGALLSIASVIRNETYWRNTQYGTAALVGKQMVPQLYMQSQNAILPIFRPLLTCD